MSFNTYPQNPFPSNSDLLKKLDSVAKAIEDMPTYTSEDRAFLDEMEESFPILQEDVSKLESYSLGTSEPIESGVTFTCPSDGYLQAYVNNNKEIDVFINGASGIRFNVKNASGTGNYYPIFVKKGMTITVTYASDDGSIVYKPLV